MRPPSISVPTEQIAGAAAVLPFTANPAQPEAVRVSRPPNVLVARAAAKTAFSGLFLGLGAVVTLVGGIGIATVRVVSVLERRGEIGLRRALGATRTHVASQFLVESALLALLGGRGASPSALRRSPWRRLPAGNPSSSPASRSWGAS
jgi:putative ABC transport system permease protein